MLSGIQAILFDMGGTLVDYPVPSWPLMAGKCIEGVYGHLVRPESALPPAATAMPDAAEAHHRRTAPAAGTPVQHRALVGLRRVVRSVSGRTLPRMAEACARMLVADGRLFDDALPAVRALEARGYRLGLVSNTPWGTPEYLWENQLERFGLGRHFKVACFSSGVGFRKPDPRIFRAALESPGGRARLDALRGRRRRRRYRRRHPGGDAVGPDPPARARSYPAPSLGAVSFRPDLSIASLEDLLDHLPARGENR